MRVELAFALFSSFAVFMLGLFSFIGGYRPGFAQSLYLIEWQGLSDQYYTARLHFLSVCTDSKVQTASHSWATTTVCHSIHGDPQAGFIWPRKDAHNGRNHSTISFGTCDGGAGPADACLTYHLEYIKVFWAVGFSLSGLTALVITPQLFTSRRQPLTPNKILSIAATICLLVGASGMSHLARRPYSGTLDTQYSASFDVRDWTASGVYTSASATLIAIMWLAVALMMSVVALVWMDRLVVAGSDPEGHDGVELLEFRRG
ncbi:hypothetical protein EV356DRAFT_529325 [Viridothelium virens]|uniref:Uncharacterized protein n=1 Tax=Viridothelium virens TaxID=1048519 RepID=A0A6A6HJN7_VIRVR|nr:hypothetical protein EV356DRAFT_529325 [Viridothelium virens]